MKQHITTEQFNELSDKGKEKLRAWWKPTEHDLYYDGEVNTWEQDIDGCISFNDTTKMTLSSGFYENKWDKAYPLLSIGQMIEFLDEHKKPINGVDLWWVPRLEFQQPNGNLYFDMSWDEELCDALWEAVKEILESDNETNKSR